MSTKRSLFDIHAAVLLFGLAGLFGKWLNLSPLIIVLGRVFFASITLALLLLYLGQGWDIRPRKHYGLLFLLGFVLAIHWVSFFQSIQISTVAIGLLAFSTFPVFTAFLEPIFFKEPLIKSNGLFSVVCLFGVFLIVPKFSLQNTSFLGVLWGLLSGFTFAVLAVYNRKLAQQHSSLSLAFYQDLFAALFLCPFLIILKPVFTGHDILLLIVLGTLCTAVSHSLFIQGMKHIRAQTASLINALEPVYGILFAFLFLHEIPSLRTVIGGSIILISQILIIIKIFR
jgi:drug/metabolite transporter (DMT)-like permease